jgi:hypothetical protein
VYTCVCAYGKCPVQDHSLPISNESVSTHQIASQAKAKGAENEGDPEKSTPACEVDTAVFNDVDVSACYKDGKMECSKVPAEDPSTKFFKGSVIHTIAIDGPLFASYIQSNWRFIHWKHAFGPQGLSQDSTPNTTFMFVDDALQALTQFEPGIMLLLPLPLLHMRGLCQNCIAKFDCEMICPAT